MTNDAISPVEKIASQKRDTRGAQVAPKDMTNEDAIARAAAAWNRRAECTGRWIEDSVVRYGYGDDDSYIERVYRCSKCGRIETEKEPYCNCGAHMIGDNEDETD